MNKPRIVARFKLDGEGRPEAVEAGGHRHYRIELRTEEAPEDTYAVNYELHDTYYDPMRESRRHDEGFAEPITSYGDFDVKAKIRTRNRVEVVSAPLSRALAQGHRDDANPAIRRAIEDIGTE